MFTVKYDTHNKSNSSDDNQYNKDKSNSYDNRKKNEPSLFSAIIHGLLLY